MVTYIKIHIQDELCIPVNIGHLGTFVKLSFSKYQLTLDYANVRGVKLKPTMFILLLYSSFDAIILTDTQVFNQITCR